MRPAAASAAAERGIAVVFNVRMDERSFNAGVQPAPAVGRRRTARNVQKTQVYISPEASGNVLPFGRLVPGKAWSTKEEADLIRIVERDGFGSWKSKANELGTRRCPDMVRAKAKAIRVEKDKALLDGLLPVGTSVEALYHHVKPHEYSAWYRAKITKVDERGGTYVIDWEDGDENLRTQPAQNVRPLPWGALPLANAENADAERTAGDTHTKHNTVHAAGETDQKSETNPQQRAQDKAAGNHQHGADGVHMRKCSTDKSEGAEEPEEHNDGSEDVEDNEESNEDETRGEGHRINRQQGKERYGDERGRRLAWSIDEQNQLRKMLRAGRNDWEAMGACIGLGRTGPATKQFATHLRTHNDLKIDKRSAKVTEWKVMSQPIDRKGDPSWRQHCCIDAAILERWAGAGRYRSCPTQREVRDDPLLCIDIKRANILKRCVNGTARTTMHPYAAYWCVCRLQICSWTAETKTEYLGYRWKWSPESRPGQTLALKRQRQEDEQNEQQEEVEQSKEEQSCEDDHDAIDPIFAVSLTTGTKVQAKDDDTQHWHLLLITSMHLRNIR